jgi:two-component system response regulator YesN
MCKVLIVDDERIIRDGIANVINWEENGFTLLGTAADGIDAYERIKNNVPDIVITDIIMPGMNGIDLIAKVSEEYKDITFIILSGHGEFDYASRAMTFGVKYYILKPCDEDTIMQTMEKVKKERKEKESLLKNINYSLKKVMPQVKEQFLREFIMGGTYSNYEIAQKNYENTNKNYGMVINEVVKCIEDNISNEKLSLTWIAREVLFMNENYLGKLFNKQTNEKFSQYVMRIRMEKAKELIVNNDYKIYEIAEKIGFADNTQYFSQVFKKYTGYTPSEYKKL